MEIINVGHSNRLVNVFPLVFEDFDQHLIEYKIVTLDQKYFI